MTDFHAADVFSVREERRRLTWPNDIPEPPPLAPPTAPGSLPPRAPNWPTVLGVIGTVLGSLGALGGLLGLLQTLVVVPLIVKESAAMPPELAAWQERWRWWMILSCAAMAVLAVLLLVASIGLLKRRRWSIGTIRSWAVVRIMWGIVAMMFTIGMTRDQMQAVSGNAPGVPPGLQTFGSLVGGGFTLMWALAPAIFVIMWFSRAAIRRQTALWT